MLVATRTLAIACADLTKVLRLLNYNCLYRPGLWTIAQNFYEHLIHRECIVGLLAYFH